jgi:hypothetical protein
MESTSKPSDEVKNPEIISVPKGKRKKGNVRMGLRVQGKELDTWVIQGLIHTQN